MLPGCPVSLELAIAWVITVVSPISKLTVTQANVGGFRRLLSGTAAAPTAASPATPLILASPGVGSAARVPVNSSIASSAV